jgi:hypothetical protein
MMMSSDQLPAESTCRKLGGTLASHDGMHVAANRWGVCNVTFSQRHEQCSASAIIVYGKRLLASR